MNEHIDELRLREALEVLKDPDQLFEIRVLMKQPRKKTLSGYFRSVDTAVDAIKDLHLIGESYFITLNTIKDACYDRIQHDRFVESPENTTNDAEITTYNWLLVDLDPVRETGVSSSADELAAAIGLGRRVFVFLKQNGFSDPVIGMSGNGVHLLYRVALHANDENETLVKRVLQALSLIFSDEKVQVDTANFNPSRICKLYGTLAQKGTGTETRPHRMSYIKYVPPKVEVTGRAQLQGVADMLPKEEKPQRYNSYAPKRFDIIGWMHEHGLKYTEKQSGDYTKYVLDECPFNSQHRAPDSMITVGGSGAIGFKCLHNSCQGKTWKDVRLLFEPDAYDRTDTDARIEAGYKAHKAYNRDRQINYEPLTEEQPDNPMFLTAMDILNMPQEEDGYIPSGIEGIDNRLGGLHKGALSLVSGLRGGSKSTILSMIALSAVNNGFNTIYYSGELTSKNLLSWIIRQAAGKWNTRPADKIENKYYVPMETQKKIARWFDGRLVIYNNDYGNDFQKLYCQLEQKIAEQKTDLILIDNLMALDIRSLNLASIYEAQKEFVLSLKELAKKTRTHIMFVAHPRKAVGFLRLDDVSGTSDLTNLVDDAFIVHRNNNDFKRLTKEMFRWTDDNMAYSGTNVIEIAKDREEGTQDVFIPMWYEKQTKRLLNSAAEVFHYGWEPDKTPDGFTGVDPDEPIPF